jgi:predicted RNA-binding Zn-ribbon protein involved in translation (DUF1610 family)
VDARSSGANLGTRGEVIARLSRRSASRGKNATRSDNLFVMIEIPKGPMNTQFRSGGDGSGVQCKNCGFEVPIGGNLSKLPEMFEAKCRTCGETRIYRSGEIHTLAAVPKQ